MKRPRPRRRFRDAGAQRKFFKRSNLATLVRPVNGPEQAG
jgi:hypothetical protein